MVRWNLVRAINLATGRDKRPTRRVSDPRPLCEELLRSGGLRLFSGGANASVTVDCV